MEPTLSLSFLLSTLLWILLFFSFYPFRIYMIMKMHAHTAVFCVLLSLQCSSNVEGSPYKAFGAFSFQFFFPMLPNNLQALRRIDERILYFAFLSNAFYE
eukprot:TRINITY_DN32399_c0_g1_i1.p1 TRINITY_DN32399_c0_g1~~TRINITY_DN32399_c0_g1_i1.p1  ORF type:complete len:100 (+),score=5.64 TRINITY_DN32399_c0_g1_i1:107-406(+)